MKSFTHEMFNNYYQHKDSYNRWYFEYTSAIGALSDESTKGDYNEISFIKGELDEIEIYIKPYLECLRNE